MERHIYLPPPANLWRIPETDVVLSRANPYRKLDGTEFDDLTEDKRRLAEDVLRRGIELGSIISLHPEFVQKDPESWDTLYILSLSADQIQRKFIARMKGDAGIELCKTLIEQEKAQPSPRQKLLALLSMKLEVLEKVQKNGRVVFGDQSTFFGELQGDEEDLLLEGGSARR